MTTASKRLVLVSVAALVVLVGLFWFVPLSGPGFRADSVVFAEPHTNTLFARTFETNVVQTIPGVLRLHVAPTFMIRGSSRIFTNGVEIHITAVGSTEQEAVNAANEAATRLCGTVLTNYGVAGKIVQEARTARSYSYFRDSFQPAVTRLFKR